MGMEPQTGHTVTTVGQADSLSVWPSVVTSCPLCGPMHIWPIRFIFGTNTTMMCRTPLLGPKAKSLFTAVSAVSLCVCVCVGGCVCVCVCGGGGGGGGG